MKNKGFFFEGKLTEDSIFIIKGIAILLIILYNFVRHLLSVDGNEMIWSDYNVSCLINGFLSKRFPLFAVSYWGWYGVPLFLFLSGYGLTIKYGEQNINTCQYIYNHAKKLFLLLMPTYCAYLFIHVVVFKIPYPFTLFIKQCTFTANFLSDYMNPGVYWFFGLMMQFYLIYILVRKVKNKLYILCFSIIIEYIILYFSNCSVLLKHNFLGWTSSFVFGMIIAEKKNMPSIKTSWLCLSLFLVSSLLKPLSPFSPLFFIVFIIGIKDMFCFKWVYFTGVLSSYLFVIHPLVRYVLYNTSFSMVISIPMFLLGSLFLSYLYYTSIIAVTKKRNIIKEIFDGNSKDLFYK